MSEDALKELTEFASGRRLREELKAGGFTAAVDAMLVIDATGKIVAVNPAVTDLFWYTEDELLGAPVDMLVPERFRPLHAQHRIAYVRNPVARSMGAGRELPGLRKDGLEFLVEISINKLPHRNEMFFMASIREPIDKEKIKIGDGA